MTKKQFFYLRNNQFFLFVLLKVLFVTNEELKSQVSVEILPDYLGGSVQLNHRNWLTECNKLVTNKSSTCNYYYAMSNNNNNSSKSQILKVNGTVKPLETTNEILSNRKRQSTDVNGLDEKKSFKKQIPNNLTSESTNSLMLDTDKIQPLPFSANFYESIQNVNGKEPAFRIDELLEHVKKTGADGLSEEFKSIRNQPMESSFDVFKSQENNYKNRYRDVVCYDETRIKLARESSKNFSSNTNALSRPNQNQNGNETTSSDDFENEADEIEEDLLENDYIHANFVDGYKQKHAYISTQGPLEETIEDFWLMIWQQTVLSIAMTTKVVESKKLKCEQYWPLEKDQSFKIGGIFEIKNTDVEDLGDYKITKLTIKHLPVINLIKFSPYAQVSGFLLIAYGL